MANLFKYPVEVEDKAVALYEEWFTAKTFHFRKVMEGQGFYSLKPEEQYAWRHLAKTILDKEKELNETTKHFFNESLRGSVYYKK